MGIEDEADPRNDGIESAQPVDGPLPDLFEKSAVSDGAGQPGAEIFTREQAAKAAAEAGETLEPNVENPAQKRKAGIQARIDKLVRKSYEKENENLALRNQLALMSEKLAKVEAYVGKLPGTRAAPPADAAGTVAGFLDDPTQQPATRPVPQDIGAMVREVVAEAIRPLVEERRATVEHSAKLTKWAAAFEEVAQEYPDLKQPGSELRQIYEVIEQARPDLNVLDDKPKILATMARGILADARRAERAATEKKRSAAVHVPNPAPMDDVPAAEATQSKQVKDAVTSAKERMRNGQATFADYKLVRMAGRRPQ